MSKNDPNVKLDAWGRRNPGWAKACKVNAEKKAQRKAQNNLTQKEWGVIHEKAKEARIEKIALLEATKALNRRKYNKNPFEIIRDGILEIKTKEHGIRPLDISNRYVQQKFLDMIEEDWFDKRPLRYIIAKSRRHGISTLVEAVLFCLVGKLIGMNGLVVSDDQDGSNYLIDMTRLYHERIMKYDRHIFPHRERDNPKKVRFAGTNSEIYIDTARNVALGRKYTYHLAHLSEVAFYMTSVEKMMLGLFQTISDMPYTAVFIESTSNGVGNYFHRSWVRAENKLSAYKAVFFGRYLDPDNRKSFQSSEDKRFLMDTLEEEEKEDWIRMKEVGYDGNEIFERINWRRHCIANQCDGSVDNFHQEYPATAAESFLLTGRPRFNIKKLMYMRKITVSPKKRGTYFRSEWEETGSGDIQIWKEPQPGHKYVIGVDTMRGKLVAESTREPDYNAAVVLDIKTMEMVAKIHNRDDSDIYANKVWCLAMWYHNAFLGIENNQGQGVITYIKSKNYWYLYQSTVYDETDNRQQKAIGWHKNQKTQILMEVDLAAAIRDLILTIPDKATVEQLTTYIINEEGKSEAQTGCWDDLVVSLGIAFQMIQHAFLEKERQVNPEDIPYTMAWERKRIIAERAGRGRRRIY